MILLIGDIHGQFKALKRLVEHPNVPEDALILQVGDFGYWPQLAEDWKRADIKRQVRFIDGNHDYIPELLSTGSSWHNASFLPRGTVIEHSGIRILACGGSKSVDRKWREKDHVNHGWFEREQLSESELFTAELAGKQAKIDLLITHTPGESLIKQEFSPAGLAYFGIEPLSWVDESARRVERLWNSVGRPMWVSGHMHRSVKSGNQRILNIAEIMVINGPEDIVATESGATDSVPSVNS